MLFKQNLKRYNICLHYIMFKNVGCRNVVLRLSNSGLLRFKKRSKEDNSRSLTATSVSRK